MKIKKITSRNRRDFWAIYVCEHCGTEVKSYGYDDRNFHDNVIPDMECMSCGKKAPDTYLGMATKYPENLTV